MFLIRATAISSPKTKSTAERTRVKITADDPRPRIPDRAQSPLGAYSARRRAGGRPPEPDLGRLHPLFVGLGVDFGIQLCVRFNAERNDGADTPHALQQAARALGAPLLLAAGAIFLGFGAFLPTAYIGIAELGVIAGIGMVIALALSVTLLPALVLLLRPGAPTREVGFVGLAPVDRFLDRRRRWVLWAFVVAMIASIGALPWVRFDFNPLDLRSPNGPAMRTLTDLTRDPSRTPNTIDVLVPDRAAAQALARPCRRCRRCRETSCWTASCRPTSRPSWPRSATPRCCWT